MKKRLKVGAGPDVGVRWDWVYHAGPHGVWLLAHAKEDKLDSMQGEVVELLEEHGAELTETQENGFRWSDDECGKVLREPFGFKDGLSGMNFFARLDETPKHVRMDLDQLVIKEGSHAGGSFLVLRKLDQNVKAFRDFESVMRQTYAARPGALPFNEPGALLVGRERDGTPLADLPDSGKPNAFDFNQDKSAARCPFHAHIRKANPRTDDDPQNRPHGVAQDLPHEGVQFVRRSVVYDEEEQLPRRASANYAEGAKIKRGVGLLFMGYMANIEEQFERMQRRWVNEPNFPFIAPAGEGIVDPVLFGPGDEPAAWNWNGVRVPNPKLSKFVTSRGGAYFYVPSMTWLKKPTA